MQYVNFGNTGLIVSKLCFGAMTFGEGDLVGELRSNIGQDTANDMIKKSLDAGINFFLHS
jgi:aryl-alcohol dehydrogenase-like predicted oxidoreductase